MSDRIDASNEKIDDPNADHKELYLEIQDKDRS